MSSWLLDQTQWDGVLDANGNIAVATAPYSIAQDAACQVKTFRGECWYDSSQGVPYWQGILGGAPPASFVKANLEQQALLVPDVATANATVPPVNSSRGLTPTLTVTDTDGNTIAVA